MLFSTKLNDINNTLANYSQEIEDLQHQLKALREQKKALENHAQQLSSAENAAESALEQVRTALMMVRAIAPSEIATFKAAVDELFESNEEIPVIEEEKEPEVTVEEVVEEGATLTIEVKQLEIETEEAEGNLTEIELKKYTTAQLKAIAQYLNITTKCKYKAEWVSVLAGFGVVRQEVEKVLKEIDKSN